MVKNDDIYGIVKAIMKLMEKILYYGLPPLIASLMMDSKGMIFGKEKDGIFDFDVRPIVIAPSVIRLLDKVIMALHQRDRRELIGPYQLMGDRQALEIGKVVMAQARRMQIVCPRLAFVNLDAWNAYNSGSRNSTHEIVSSVSKRLANWFKFLYQRDNNVSYDYMTSIPMQTGVIQGLASSEMFFSCIKWHVFKKVIAKIRKLDNRANLFMEVDYVDDGISLMSFKHIEMFTNECEKEFDPHGIRIKKEKSKIVVNTKDKEICD